MTKHLANYVGFATDPALSPGQGTLHGIWNLFDQYRLKTLGKWTTTPKTYAFIMTATGTVTTGVTDVGDNFFTFTGPGTISCPGPATAEVFLVGGGGGGGYYSTSGNGGGGGGAGGLVYVPSMPFGPGSFPVTVGAGGNSARANGTQAGSNGGNSTINGFTALGGGFGAGYFSGGPSGPNGSGGTGNSGPTPADQPTQPQPLPAPNYEQFGNPGGSGNASPGNYDGGGGAGSSGVTPTPSPSPGYGGQFGGGAGRLYPQFAGPNIGLPAQYPLSERPVSNGWYAGGGGGGGYTSPDGRPWGSGIGGGGGPKYGPDGTPTNSYNAVANTGGGGAGGANSLYVGSGGSGIVVVIQKA